MRWLAALVASLKALSVASLAGSGTAHAQEPLGEGDWAEAIRSGNAEACQSYLERFPAGPLAEEAFRCLVESELEPAAGPETGVDVY